MFAIFKHILVISSLNISHAIVPGWTPGNLTGDQPTLVPVMAWCRYATSYYLTHCCLSFMTFLVVLYRMFPFIICLILMNYLMEFYFIGFVNAHLPGCFCPWTFRLNIGLNTSPSDSFVSYLNSHLGYSAGEFQALQLIVLAVFGAVD